MSKIEWTDETWNPVRGCSRVSEGCRNCYAERMAARFCRPAHEGRQPFRGCSLGSDGIFRRKADPFHGFAGFRYHETATGRVGFPHWTGRVELIPEKLDEPLRWRKPRMVFVNSMSDLFHEALDDDDIDRVFAVMKAASRHTFQVLTKRADRMCRYGHLTEVLPNVWLGVSVEDQKTADERIPLLLQTPAALRFVSYEPALGPVKFGQWLCGERQARGFSGGPRVDQVIVGGESGPGARPCNVQWIRDVIRQCRDAGVPAFVKQLGARGHNLDARRPRDQKGLRLKHPKGGDPAEWPEDLRVREFPHVAI